MADVAWVAPFAAQWPLRSFLELGAVPCAQLHVPRRARMAVVSPFLEHEMNRNVWRGTAEAEAMLWNPTAAVASAYGGQGAACRNGTARRPLRNSVDRLNVYEKLSGATGRPFCELVYVLPNERAGSWLADPE